MEQQGREGECKLEERADQIQNPRHFLIRIYPVLDDGSKFYLITSQPPLNHLLPTLNAVNQGEIM